MEESSRATSRCFIFMYFLFPHWVPATWRSRAQTSIRAELPSGKLPTTRVRRRISRFSLSITALFSCRFKCSCPPRRQRHFHGNADRAYNTLHFASKVVCQRGSPFGNPGQQNRRYAALSGSIPPFVVSSPFHGLFSPFVKFGVGCFRGKKGL